MGEALTVNCVESMTWMTDEQSKQNPCGAEHQLSNTSYALCVSVVQITCLAIHVYCVCVVQNSSWSIQIMQFVWCRTLRKQYELCIICD